eukprot:scaffold8626_cov202-Skeletonema_dohrnii-CCMP3373.AAC.2
MGWHRYRPSSTTAPSILLSLDTIIDWPRLRSAILLLTHPSHHIIHPSHHIFITSSTGSPPSGRLALPTTNPAAAAATTTAHSSTPHTPPPTHSPNFAAAVGGLVVGLGE